LIYKVLPDVFFLGFFSDCQPSSWHVLVGFALLPLHCLYALGIDDDPKIQDYGTRLYTNLTPWIGLHWRHVHKNSRMIATAAGLEQFADLHSF
jgi:hypothetical protein